MVFEMTEEETGTSPALNEQVQEEEPFTLVIGAHGQLKEGAAEHIAAKEGSEKTYTYTVPAGKAETADIISDIEANIEGVNAGWKFKGLAKDTNGSAMITAGDETNGEITKDETYYAIFEAKSYELAVGDVYGNPIEGNRIVLAKQGGYPLYIDDDEQLTFSLKAKENGDELPVSGTELTFEAIGASEEVSKAATVEFEPKPEKPFTVEAIFTAKNVVEEEKITVKAYIGANDDKVEVASAMVSVKTVAYGTVTVIIEIGEGASWKEGKGVIDNKLVRVPTSEDAPEGTLTGQALLSYLTEKGTSGEDIIAPEGKQFKEWQISNKAVEDDTEYAASSSNGEITIKAVYEDKQYDIRYHVFLGSSKTEMTKEDLSEKSIELPTKDKYTRTDIAEKALELASVTGTTPVGYQAFDGWYSDADFKNKITEIEKYEDGKTLANIDLYGRFATEAYTVKIGGFYEDDEDNDGKVKELIGVSNPNSVKSYTVESEDITFKTPAKNGYTFAGWYTKVTEESGTYTLSDSDKTDGKIAKGSTGEKTFVGYFKKNATVESIAFDNSAVVLQAPDENADPKVPAGTSKQTVTVSPETGNNTITYTSLNEKVATVSGNGKEVTITAVGVGTTTVTARAGNKTATITVTVQKNAVNTVEHVRIFYGQDEEKNPIDQSEKTVNINDIGTEKNQTLTLSAKAFSDDEYKTESDEKLQGVIWNVAANQDGSGDASAIASVNASGTVVVKPQKDNVEFYVIATSKADGKKSAWVKVTVSRYYTVTFEDEMDPTAAKTIYVKSGAALSTGKAKLDADDTIGAFDAPKKIDGYNDASWQDVSVEPAKTYENTNTLDVQKNLTLTAVREATPLVITLNYNGASKHNTYDSDKGTDNANITGINSADLSYTVKSGTIDLSDKKYQPTLDKYTFKEWQIEVEKDGKKEKEMITSFDAADYPEGITLYAIFTKDVESLVWEDSANSSSGNKANASYVLTKTAPNNELTTVVAKMAPDNNADIDGIEYSVSPKTGVVTVDQNGKVTVDENAAVGSTATVIATAGEKTISYDVTIDDEIMTATDVEITRPETKTYKFYEKDATTEDVDFLPESLTLEAKAVHKESGQDDKDASDKNVIWTAEAKTDNGGTATVIEGLVSINAETDVATATFDTSKLATNAEVTFTATAASTTGNSEPVKAEVKVKIERYYKLTLDPNGGNLGTPENASQWIKDQETLPTLPDGSGDPAGIAKTGYSLDVTTPWAVKGTDGTPDTTATLPNKINGADVTLIANWKAKDVTVNFDYGKQDNNTDLLSPNTPNTSAKFGETITGTDAKREVGSQIDAEGKTGVKYRFVGWFEKNEDDTLKNTAFDFTKPIAVEGPINLFAKTERLYKVTFDLNESNATSAAPEAVYIADGEMITEPAKPTAEGKKFKEWRRGDAETAFKFGESVEFEDTEKTANGFTLKAEWENDPRTVKVAYDLGNVAIKDYTIDGASKETATSVPAQEDIKVGAKIKEVTVTPSDEANYTFDGWYNGDTKWDSASDVITDAIANSGTLTLTAHWKVTEYDVKFYLEKEATEAFNTIKIPYNNQIAAEMLSEIKNTAERTKGMGTVIQYTLTGWKNASNDSDVDLKAAITNSLNVYGVFEEIPDEEGAKEAFDSAFSNGIVIVTNNFAAGTTVAGLKLSDIVSSVDDNTWKFAADKATSKTVASYAKKGSVALPLTYTTAGGATTITVPVRFVTITGMTSAYDGTRLKKDDELDNLTTESSKLYYRPITAGGSIDDDATIKDAVMTVFNDAGVTWTGAQTTKKPAGVITWSGTDKKFVVAADTTSATNIALKLTATFKDGKNVSGTASVMVAPAGIEFKEFASEDLDEDTDYMSKTSANAAFAKNLAKNAVATVTGSIDTTNATATKITVVSDNAKIVKPASKTVNVADGKFSFRLKAGGAYGTAILTLTANDTAKTTATVCVTVYPSEVTLSTTKATLNMTSLKGQQITITPKYDVNSQAAENIGLVVIDSVQVKKAKGNTLSEAVLKNYFEVEQEGNKVELKLTGTTMDDIYGMVPGTYIVTLAEEGGSTLGKPVTVTVSNSQPSTTVKQKAALNLNFKPEAGRQALAISSKAGTPSDVKFLGVDTDAPFKIEADNGVYYVLKNEDAPSITKNDGKKSFTVALNVPGYREYAIRKAVKVSVTDKLPALKLSASSVTMYPGLTKQNLTLSVAGKKVTDFTVNEPEIKLTGALDTNYNVGTDNGNVLISAKNGAVKAKGTLTYHDDTLESGVVLSAKFEVKTGKVKNVKTKLGKASVSLNANAPNDMIYVPVSVTGLTGDYEYEITDPVTPIKGNAAIEVKVGTDASVISRIGNYLEIGWKDGTTPPTKGSFTYNITMKVKENGEVMHNAPAAKLTVKAVNKALAKSATFSQKGSIDLMKEGSAITITPKLSGINGTVNYIELTGRDAALFKVERSSDHRVWYLRPSQSAASYVTGYKYDVKIGAVEIAHDDYTNVGTYSGNSWIANVNKKLNVTVKQTKPSLKLTPASGTVFSIENGVDNTLPVSFKASVANADEPAIKSITQVYDKAIGSALQLKDVNIDSTDKGHGTFNIVQTKMLRKGTYTVKLLVIYEDQAANAKDTVVSFKVVVK